MGAPGPLAGAALVGLGGAAGAAARYGVVRVAARRGGAQAWAVTAINLTGSAALGGLYAMPGVGAGGRLLFGMGVCGGFTTFSTYAVESLRHWQAGRLSLLAMHLFLNAFGCPVAALLSGTYVRSIMDLI